MTLEIDIDKLNARKEELANELKQITDLLILAQQFSRPAPPSIPVALPPIPTPAPQPSTLQPGPFSTISTRPPKERSMTPGLRRAVTLALHTGPATESDLAKALAWPVSRVATVSGSMLRFRLIYLDEHGRLSLAEEGKKQAQWFLLNPEYLVYVPNRGNKAS